MKGPRGVDLIQGEEIELHASGAETAGGNGDWVYVGGERQRITFICDVTALATATADKLDVYIDMSFDGVTADGNAVHFTQFDGDGSAAKELATLEPSTPGAAIVVITADAAETVVRPQVFGPYYRTRWAIVNDTTPSFTFEVKAWAE